MPVSSDAVPRNETQRAQQGGNHSVRTVAQRTQHMLEYCTGLHLVGIG